MIHINEAIVVEGVYDKNTLSRITDAFIIETHGFGIFKDKNRMTMLRLTAERKGLIILTDSDNAGFMIRNHIKAAIDNRYLKHAYIPDIYGKEKRKRKPSKEGKLGVEGMPEDVLADVLKRAGACVECNGEVSQHSHITKADMYKMGLSGKTDSSLKRNIIKKMYDLPENMSTDELLEMLNILITREEFFNLNMAS